MAQNPSTPPQALEAEMAVLGSMLIEREASERALDLLHETVDGFGGKPRLSDRCGFGHLGS